VWSENPISTLRWANIGPETVRKFPGYICFLAPKVRQFVNRSVFGRWTSKFLRAKLLIWIFRMIADCNIRNSFFVFTGWKFGFSTTKFPQIHHKYLTFSGNNRAQIVRRNNLQKFHVYNTWFGDNNSTWPWSFLCPLFQNKPRNFGAKSRRNYKICNTWLRCHPYQPFHFPVQFIPSFETS